MPDNKAWWLATYEDACPRCRYTPLHWREKQGVIEWRCVDCGWQRQEAPAVAVQLQPAALVAVAA